MVKITANVSSYDIPLIIKCSVYQLILSNTAISLMERVAIYYAGNIQCNVLLRLQNEYCSYTPVRHIIICGKAF